MSDPVFEAWKASGQVPTRVPLISSTNATLLKGINGINPESVLRHSDQLALVCAGLGVHSTALLSRLPRYLALGKDDLTMVKIRF